MKLRSAMLPEKRKNYLNSMINQSWYRWVVYVLAILSFTIAVMLTSISVIIPELMRDLEINAAKIGVLGSVYAVVYAVMQIPGGILADRFGPRKVMALALLVGGLGIVLFSLAPNYRSSLFGRVVTGLGVSILYVNHIKVIRGWFSTEEMGMVMGIGSSINSVGALIATPLLAYASSKIGWRVTFVIIGVITVLFSLLVWVFLRDHSPHIITKDEVKQSVRLQLNNFVKMIFSNDQYIVLFLIALCSYGGISVLYHNWGIPFLMQSYGYSKMDAAWIITFSSLFSLIGAPLSGYLSDRVFKKRKPIIISGLIGLTIPMIIIGLFGSHLGNVSLITIFSFLGLTMNGVLLTYTLINEMVPPSLSGLFSAFVNMGPYVGSSIFMYISGLLLGDPLGYASDGTPFYGLEKYQGIFRLSAVVGIVAIFISFYIRENKQAKKSEIGTEDI